MSLPTPELISPPPGPIKSFFIHLAGGDPRAFVYLPPHEASDYAKLGASVLVPVALALTAGTFTLLHLQSSAEPNYPLAIIGGILWALVILVIDVAVMSQIVKTVSLPPMNTVGRGERQRAFARTEAKPEPVVPPPSRTHNVVIAAMRIGIAVVLGMLMSHSLVLEVFKNQIRERLNLQHELDKEKYKRLPEATAQARGRLDQLTALEGEANNTTFLNKYNAMLAAPAAGGVLTPAVGTAPVPIAAYTDPELAAAQKDLQDEVAKQKAALDDAKSTREISAKKLSDFQNDQRVANGMLRDENRGEKAGSYPFRSPEYIDALGTSTSGAGGKGPLYTRIKAFLQQKNEEIRQREEELKTLDDSITALQKKQAEQKSDLDGRIDKVKKRLIAAGDIATLERERTLSSTAQNRRKDLANAIRIAQTDYDRARKEEDAKLKPLKDEGDKSDLLQRTSALIDFIVGSPIDAASAAPVGELAFKRPILLTLVFLTLLSLILVDLTPLTMKLLRAPGLYDQYLLMVRSAGFHFASQGGGRPVPPVNNPNGDIKPTEPGGGLKQREPGKAPELPSQVRSSIHAGASPQRVPGSPPPQVDPGYRH